MGAETLGVKFRGCFVDHWPALLLGALLAASRSAAESSTPQLSPAPGAAGVCIDTPLRLSFKGDVGLGTNGRITVHRADDDRIVDTLDLAAAGFTNNFGGKLLHYEPLQVRGGEVSVALHSHSLEYGQTYYVVVDAGVVRRADGAFSGIPQSAGWRFTTKTNPPPGRTHLVVATDGTGDFRTTQGAIDAVPDDNQLPVTIFFRKGSYEGLAYVPPDKGNIHFVGEDRKATVLCGRNNDRYNSSRLQRSLINVDADNFTLENMTLWNTTPAGGSQAEALRVRGDRCALRNADFRSFQDTLLLSGRVYVTNCYIEGDVDFIWGQGAVFFDRCEIRAVRNGYYLQSRNPVDKPGYVFYHCKLSATTNVAHCVLARIEADRFPGSEAIFIDCEMGPHVPRAAWDIKGTNVSRLRFEEIGSVDAAGKPIDLSGRHPASHQLTVEEAAAKSDPALFFKFAGPWNPGVR